MEPTQINSPKTNSNLLTEIANNINTEKVFFKFQLFIYLFFLQYIACE